ncbi:MAG: type II toxin-antitoxin system VapC family toxin [Methanophagales archaeon]|nr:type II toxin-antitoxin system VapC family toxin [Methanophagales archaeon]
MIVIDASAIAKYVLKEEHWEQVRDYLTAEPRSLDLALAEVSNAIWKHQVIYRKISSSEATVLFKVLQKLGADVLILESFAGYLRGATEIAVKEKLTIYDALYIVQAQRYGHFVTSDDFQRKIAVKLGLDVVFIE